MTAENYKKFLLNCKDKGIAVEPPVKSLRRDSRGQVIEHIDESRVAIYNEVFSEKKVNDDRGKRGKSGN